MASKRNVGGSTVREWATSDEGKTVLAEKGLTVGLRGKFSDALLTEFHAANRKLRYVPNHVPTREIKGMRETSNGRKVPVKVNATLAEVRAFAEAEGLTIGKRGRVSQATMAAFAARPRV